MSFESLGRTSVWAAALTQNVASTAYLVEFTHSATFTTRTSGLGREPVMIEVMWLALVR